MSATHQVPDKTRDNVVIQSNKMRRAIMKLSIIYYSLLVCAATNFATGAPETNRMSQGSYATKYPAAHGRDLTDFASEVLGTGYTEKKTTGNHDRFVTVKSVGAIRCMERLFRKETNVVVTITCYEGESAESVTEYFKKYVATTYAAGAPPINNTYGIGDLVLSWQNRDQITNRALFVVFFNNVAVECRIAAENGNIGNEMESILKRLDSWARKGTIRPPDG